jgi:hypothetical protein
VSACLCESVICCKCPLVVSVIIFWKCSKNMCSNYKQCYFIKIQVAHWQNAQHCHRGLQEACGKHAVPYLIVVRWVHVFQGGRESSEHKLGAGQQITAVDDVHVAHVSTLLDTNWQWTCARLLSEIGISLSTINRILKENLKMQKIVHNGHQWSDRGIHVATYGNYQDSIWVIMNMKVE